MCGQKKVKGRKWKQNTDCLHSVLSVDLKEEQGKSALWVNLQWLLKFDLLGSRNCKQLLSTITLKADRNLEQVHLSFYHTPSCSSLLKPWLHIHTFFLFSTLNIRAHPSPLTSVRVRWLAETAHGEIPELNISADTAMGCEWLLDPVVYIIPSRQKITSMYHPQAVYLVITKLYHT